MTRFSQKSGCARCRIAASFGKRVHNGGLSLLGPVKGGQHGGTKLSFYPSSNLPAFAKYLGPAAAADRSRRALGVITLTLILGQVGVSTTCRQVSLNVFERWGSPPFPLGLIKKMLKYCFTGRSGMPFRTFPSAFVSAEILPRS